MATFPQKWNVPEVHFGYTGGTFWMYQRYVLDVPEVHFGSYRTYVLPDRRYILDRRTYVCPKISILTVVE